MVDRRFLSFAFMATFMAALIDCARVSSLILGGLSTDGRVCGFREKASSDGA